MFGIGKIGMKDIEVITPLDDPRWSGFVDLHPKASIFHTREWMAAPT